MAVNTTINEPPAFLRDYYAALAERGMNLGNLGFTPYTQPRVAPWNAQQDAASQMIQQRALSGSPAMNQAGDWFSQMMSGGLGVGNVAAPGQIGQVNPALGPSSIESGGTLTPGTNPYAGMDNPYLNQTINRAMGDVESRINSRFNNNAFGGTAHQQTLARELGNVSNNMRMQDYGTQQQLAESAVGRGMQAGQFNIGNQNAMNQFNANLGFQNAGIQNQMGLANAGLQGQNIQNQMATNQFNAGLQGQNLGRQQQALSFAPTLAANDYADAQAMMGLGNQLQGYNQQIADANYQEFMRQQAYPGQQLSYMQAGLNPAANAFRNTTQTTPDPQSNTFANMGAGGMLGYAAGSGLGFSNPWWGALGGAALGGLL